MSKMIASSTRTLLDELGWVVIDLPRPGVVEAVARYLRTYTFPYPGPLLRLEEYDEADNERHLVRQALLTKMLADLGSLPRMVQMQAQALEPLVGPEFLVQRNPYLRIARPGAHVDNVGYHRDTDYGALPGELSVWVPFSELPSGARLQVVDASHREQLEPVAMTAGSTGVLRGSLRHQLGHPYAPKVLPEEVTRRAHEVPVEVGQALVFHLSLVHGTTCNYSDAARWSADVRVAPAAMRDDVRPGYYLEGSW